MRLDSNAGQTGSTSQTASGDDANDSRARADQTRRMRSLFAANIVAGQQVGRLDLPTFTSRQQLFEAELASLRFTLEDLIKLQDTFSEHAQLMSRALTRGRCPTQSGLPYTRATSVDGALSQHCLRALSDSGKWVRGSCTRFSKDSNCSKPFWTTTSSFLHRICGTSWRLALSRHWDSVNHGIDSLNKMFTARGNPNVRGKSLPDKSNHRFAELRIKRSPSTHAPNITRRANERSGPGQSWSTILTLRMRLAVIEALLQPLILERPHSSRSAFPTHGFGGCSIGPTRSLWCTSEGDCICGGITADCSN